MCANPHVNLCVFGCESTCECVCVCEWCWTDVRDSTGESVCLGAAVHVIVGVCE